MMQFNFKRFTAVIFLAFAAVFASRAYALNQADVVRFLEQASWGPDDASIARLNKLASFNAYLDEQFQLPASKYPTPAIAPADSRLLCTDPAGAAICRREHYTQYPNQVAFFKLGLMAKDQLRQRVAFALHEIFVVSGLKISQPVFMARYLNLLLDDAFDNYRNILTDMTLSPAMGQYLNMVNSKAATGNKQLHPNENYARELLQLFTIGENWLNEDGSLMLDGHGQPLATYDQNAILGFSQAFTGWSFAPFPDPGAAQQLGAPNYNDPMVVYRNGKGVDIYHDKQSKTLLSLTPNGHAVVLPAGQDAELDMRQALDTVFNHPNLGVFIGKQLIQHLVTSNPSPAYVKRVSRAFDQGSSHGFGSGQRGDMRALIAAILLDQEARGSVKRQAEYGHLREPVQLVLNAMRAFNVPYFERLYNQTQAMGQHLFYSVSVFNYYPHSYYLPGNSLQGPEFGIESSSGALSRLNFVNLLVFGPKGLADATFPVLDFTGLQALAGNPPALVNRLDNLLLHGTMPAEMRSILLGAVNGIPSTDLLGRAQTAMYLALASAQYQVQR